MVEVQIGNNPKVYYRDETERNTFYINRNGVLVYMVTDTWGIQFPVGEKPTSISKNNLRNNCYPFVKANAGTTVTLTQS